MTPRSNKRDNTTIAIANQITLPCALTQISSAWTCSRYLGWVLDVHEPVGNAAAQPLAPLLLVYDGALIQLEGGYNGLQ